MSKRVLDMPEKLSMVDADDFHIIDSEDATLATKDKRVKRSNALAGYATSVDLTATKNDLSDHEADTTNPHNVTAAQVGADPTGSAATVQSNLTTHENDTTNPHNVTAVQAGADPVGTASTAVSAHDGLGTAHGNRIPTAAIDAALKGAVLPSGANVFVTESELPPGSSDDKVAASSTDTTPADLLAKLTSSDASVTFTKTNPGGDEQVDVKAASAGGVTNITIGNRTATSFDVQSSSGSDGPVPAATETLAGGYPAADKAKVNALGSAAYTASTDYATAAQGALADSATQPADLYIQQNEISARIVAGSGPSTGISSGELDPIDALVDTRLIGWLADGTLGAVEIADLPSSGGGWVDGSEVTYNVNVGQSVASGDIQHTSGQTVEIPFSSTGALNFVATGITGNNDKTFTCIFRPSSGAILTGLTVNSSPPVYESALPSPFVDNSAYRLTVVVTASASYVEWGAELT